ncbi:MAG: hypothetical protein J5858_01690 [Lentisphaeria bacterium]|nr:hypothetical protein [Lentisphaeria bacterium]
MRNSINMNGVWNFTFREEEGMPLPERIPANLRYESSIAVPGCFDVLAPWFGKRGTGFFRREVHAGGLVQLSVDGLGIEGRIFWDGKFIGDCPYAYMPEKFTFEAGERGSHELVIAVSNQYNKVFFPFYDFYAFGGIFGDVTLEELPKDYLEWMRITTLDCRTGKISLKVRAGRFFRKEFPLRIQIDSKTVKTVPFSGREQEYELTVPLFKLWSPENPNLHRLELFLKNDRLEETFGIRQIEIKGTKLLLNGKELRLFGYNRHESHPEFGAASPPSLMAADLQMVKDQGANFIRGSHYPQRKKFLQLCDQIGILVWEEILGWDVKPPELFTPGFLRRQKDQARKLAAVHYNHPCIIIWGFMNETESQLPRVRSIIKKVYDAYREIDTTRPITYASNKYEKDVCMDLVDIVAMNPYPGWGGICWEEISGLAHIEPRLAEIEAAVPVDKPFMLSEIGASAIYGDHDPWKVRWSEEYQADLVKEVCRVVLNNERYCGLSFWHFCDAKSYINGGRVLGFNDKGILDRYRRPKLAWEAIREAIRGKNKKAHESGQKEFWDSNVRRKKK